MTALYLDVHVPSSIAAELRHRGADVLTAREDGTAEFTDESLLERAHSLGRLLFTQDIRFKALAESWQREGRSFSGLLFGISFMAPSANSSVTWSSSPRSPIRTIGVGRSSSCR